VKVEFRFATKLVNAAVNVSEQIIGTQLQVVPTFWDQTYSTFKTAKWDAWTCKNFSKTATQLNNKTEIIASMVLYNVTDKVEIDLASAQ